MEWCVELREGKRDGAVEPTGSGPTIWFLPASEQLYTRSCSRCAGLLVNEWCHDLLDDTGGLSIEVLRCVQCGHRVDPVILLNRNRPPVESQRVGRVQHKYPVCTVMLGEVE